MASSIAGVAAARTETGVAGASPSSPTAMEVSKDLFLKLMVAQLRNQNPLNPVDGVDFVNQLSQISGVEQMVEMRRQLEAIHDLLQGADSGSSAQS